MLSEAVFKSCSKTAAYLESLPRAILATKTPFSAQCLLPRLRMRMRQPEKVQRMFQIFEN